MTRTSVTTLSNHELLAETVRVVAVERQTTAHLIARLAEVDARPSPRAMVAPIAPERYVIKVTVSTETHAKLRRAQDLLRHTCPTGDPAAILDRALTVLVEQLERTRYAKVPRPSMSGSQCLRSGAVFRSSSARAEFVFQKRVVRGGPNVPQRARRSVHPEGARACG